MSTNLEYRARETQRKRESRRQASEAQRAKGRQRSRARDKKQRRYFFVTAVTKWEILAATNARWKWAGVKKVNKKRYDISSVKRVTKKFLEVSLVVVQNNGKEMCKKSVLHVLHLLLFFTVLRRCMPSPLSITRFYILFEQTVNIIESFAFSPG